MSKYITNPFSTPTRIPQGLPILVILYLLITPPLSKVILQHLGGLQVKSKTAEEALQKIEYQVHATTKWAKQYASIFGLAKL